MFEKSKGIWPKKFQIIDDQKKVSKFSFTIFGFSGSIYFNNTLYKLSVDPGAGGLQSHQVWTWKNLEGIENSFEIKYVVGTHPDGVQSISKNELQSCNDGLVLTMFARYIQRVYVGN